VLGEDAVEEALISRVCFCEELILRLEYMYALLGA
jgi:hypothetical protein